MNRIYTIAGMIAVGLVIAIAVFVIITF